jgi:hypothetical protein
MIYGVLPGSIKRIFIDLDDTMVDFMGAAMEIFWGPVEKTPEVLTAFNTFINDKPTHKIMWEKIEKLGPDWWEDLPKLPWADNILSACKDTCSNIAFLTSPGVSPNAAAGKIKWSNKHFGENELIMTKKKHMCACEGSLLIDDWDKFLVPWASNGGVAYQLKREWNSSGFSAEEIISLLRSPSLEGK